MERFLRLSVAPICVASIAAVTLLWPTPQNKNSVDELSFGPQRSSQRQQLSRATGVPKSGEANVGIRAAEMAIATETQLDSLSAPSKLTNNSALSRDSIVQNNVAQPRKLNEVTALPLTSEPSSSKATQPTPSQFASSGQSVDAAPKMQAPTPVIGESGLPLFNAPSNSDEEQIISEDASASVGIVEHEVVELRPSAPEPAVNENNNHTAREQSLPLINPGNDSAPIWNENSYPNESSQIDFGNGSTPALPASLQPQHTIDVENADGESLGDAMIEVTPVQLNPATIEKVRQHVENGNAMARKGALYSARSEYQQALFVLAEARDGELGRRESLKSLEAAWRAITEADDFVGQFEGSQFNLELDEIVVRHQTKLVSLQEANRISAYDAMQRYLEFAQRQLVIASGLESVASDALYGLGKIHIMPQGLETQGEKMVAAKAIVMFQAALQTNPQHARAASELGTQFAKIGEFQVAKDLYIQSLMTRPVAVTWRNLAVVHQKLGENDLAAQAFHEAELAEQQPLIEPQHAPVQMVPQQQFQSTSGGGAAAIQGLNQPITPQLNPNNLLPQVHPPQDARTNTTWQPNPQPYSANNVGPTNGWQR